MTSDRIQHRDRKNPFPGLRPYKVDEHEFYYSYGYRTSEVLSRLLTNKFVTLVGESGSGKASLVNCAIIPTLNEGFAGKGGEKWDCISFRPGTNPFKNLALALAHSRVFLEGGKIEPGFTEQLEEMLRGSVQGLLNVFEKFSLKNEHNLFIHINDFEDVFAFKDLYENEEDTHLFINLILKFIRRSNYPVYVAMSLSSDFLSASSLYPGLPEVINDSQYMIPKMDAAHLGRVISHGFKHLGIKTDPNLVDEVTQDFRDLSPGNYRLQYALKAMVDCWMTEKKRTETVEVEHYRESGGIERAVEISAEEVFAKFNSKQQEICAYLFKCVTQTGRQNRPRAVSIDSVSEISRYPVEEVIEVVNYFAFEELEFIEVIETYDIEEHLEHLDSLDNIVDNPFSEINKYSKITLRHVELINCWPRLQEWVEEEKRYMDIYLRLVNAAQLNRKGQKGYFVNPELDMALEWYSDQKPTKEWAKRYNPNFDDAIAYLIASEKNHMIQEAQKEADKKRKKRNRIIVQWSVVIVLLVICTFMFLWLKSVQRANEEVKEEKLKVDYIQNLDSVRALYIYALQNMDSAHIDQIRFKARELNLKTSSGINQILSFTEQIIRKDSLCKKGIKSEISKIDKAMIHWRDNWGQLHVTDDSVQRASKLLVTEFKHILKGHCDDQWHHLTSVHAVTGVNPSIGPE